MDKTQTSEKIGRCIVNSTHIVIDKPRSEFIRFCYFVCAMMVVGIHAYQTADLPVFSITARVQGSLSHGLFSAAVPLFFFFSGQLFFRNIDSVQDCLAKGKKRLGTLVLPFLAWSAVYVAVSLLADRFLHQPCQIERSFIGILRGIFFYECSYHLWFCFQLMVYILLSPVIHLVLKRRKTAFSIGGAVCLLGLFKLGIWEITVDGLTRSLFSLNCFAYYFLGCLSAKYPQWLYKTEAFLRKIPLTVLSVATFAMSVLTGLLFEGVLASFNNRCTVPVMAVLCYGILLQISIRCKNIPIPCKISTMVVYGIHILVGVAVSMVLPYLHLPVLADYFLWFILTACLSCLASVVVGYCKPMSILFSGGR